MFNEYTLFKYLWVIILLPKPIQLIAFIALFMTLISKIDWKQLKLDIVTTAILCYTSIHFVSILTNVINFNHDFNRIFAAVNTAAIWAVASAYYIYYRHSKLDIKKVSLYSFINICILIVFSLISVIMYYGLDIKTFSLLGSQLYKSEWFFGIEMLRLTGMFEYSNLIIFFYLLFFPLSMLHVVTTYKKWYCKVGYVVLSLLPIGLSLSRSGYVFVLGGFLLSGAYYVLQVIDYKLLLKIIGFIALVITTIFIFTDLLDFVVEMVMSLVNGREGSNYVRNVLYTQSIQLTTENSPFIGMGIKSISETGYPLGSHSTYIGLYYKTGILGTIFGLLSLGIVNIQLLVSRYENIILKFGSLFILVILGVLIGEDLDGANWLIVMYFSVSAMYLNQSHLKVIKLKNCFIKRK